MESFIKLRRHFIRMAVKSNESKKAKSEQAEAELPADPIEFARRLKKVVSEDFLRSYHAIRKVVVKH